MFSFLFHPLLYLDSFEHDGFENDDYGDVKMSAVNPPNQEGSNGGNGSPFSGNGMVAVQNPPRARQFPWPLPYSAEQGAVGGSGGLGMASVQVPPYYGPFNQYWPNFAPRLNGLPNPVVKS